MIGTGLFLSSGQVIAIAGPAGAFLAYIVMGFVTAGVAYTTGEISAFMPSTGGFIRHATRFVEPALGAATGWNFWYTMAISAPTEITAAATLVQFWDVDVSPAVWITVFGVFIVVVNFCGVRLYGESEVVFASLKIMLIVGLIIGGIVINAGGGPNHEYIGFRYWHDPGAFNEYIDTGSAGRFLAFWKVLLTSAFSYGNIQVVAISGTETRNPRKIIPAATRKTFVRVFLFYVLSIFIVGLIVRDGHAPGFFQKCNRFGTPYFAVGMTCILMPLGYMTLGSSASTVFSWFVNITTVAGLIGWIVIEVTYLRFYAGMKAQGHSRERFDVFTKRNFTASGFLTSYLNIAIFAALYIFFKFWLRSKVIPLREIDFQAEFDAMEQEKAYGDYIPQEGSEQPWYKRWIHFI
ncbi:hypothetical protein ATERTT37_003920 [Aspergillus terreus]